MPNQVSGFNSVQKFKGFPETPGNPPPYAPGYGVIWTPYDWLNKFYSCYMAAIVVIDGGCGLRVAAHCRNQSNKSKLLLYKLLLLL